MKSLSCVYVSNTGNTQAMAEALKEGMEAEGVEMYFSQAGEADKDEFLKNDVLIFASPSCGTEEVEEFDMQPFVESVKDDLDGKEVFLFGSYGWGGGEYAETWKAELESYGAKFPAEPYTIEGEPDDDAKEGLVEAVKAIL